MSGVALEGQLWAKCLGQPDEGLECQARICCSGVIGTSEIMSREVAEFSVASAGARVENNQRGRSENKISDRSHWTGILATA